MGPEQFWIGEIPDKPIFTGFIGNLQENTWNTIMQHQQYFTVKLLLFCTEGIYFKMYTVDCISLVTIEGVLDKQGFTIYNLGYVITLLLLSVRM